MVSTSYDRNRAGAAPAGSPSGYRCCDTCRCSNCSTTMTMCYAYLGTGFDWTRIPENGSAVSWSVLKNNPNDKVHAKAGSSSIEKAKALVFSRSLSWTQGLKPEFSPSSRLPFHFSADYKNETRPTSNLRGIGSPHRWTKQGLKLF